MTRPVLLCSNCLLVIPVFVAVVVFKAGLYAAWTCAAVYVVALGGTFFVRFRRGRWKTMRVIEHSPAVDVVEAESGIY